MEKEKIIIMFIVATNVVASQPPERLPTGTPHAPAKNNVTRKLLALLYESEI